MRELESSSGATAQAGMNENKTIGQATSGKDKGKKWAMYEACTYLRNKEQGNECV